MERIDEVNSSPKIASHATDLNVSDQTQSEVTYQKINFDQKRIFRSLSDAFDFISAKNIRGTEIIEEISNIACNASEEGRDFFAKSLNSAMIGMTPHERVFVAISIFANKLAVTTSGGSTTSRIIPTLISELRDFTLEGSSFSLKLPELWLIDTGNLPHESVSYATSIENDLGLKVLRFKNGLTNEQMKLAFSALTSAGVPKTESFDHLTKVLPMASLIRKNSITAWMAGNLNYDSPLRSNLQPCEYQNGLFKIFPLAMLSEGEVEEIINQRSQDELVEGVNFLPFHPHPAVKNYGIKLGNIFDTNIDGLSHNLSYRKEIRHCDATVENGAQRFECGLHEHWSNLAWQISSQLFKLEDFPVEEIKDKTRQIVEKLPWE